METQREADAGKNGTRGGRTGIDTYRFECSKFYSNTKEKMNSNRKDSQRAELDEAWR